MRGTHEYVDDPRNADIFIDINGELLPRARATVSVFDSGFILGDGVWEGLRVERGTVLFLERHLERLFEGMKTLDFEPDFDRQALARRLYTVLAANGMHDGVHIRLMVSRGVKATPYQDPRMTVSPPTVVIVPEYKDPLPKTVDRGVRLFTVHVRRGYDYVVLLSGACLPCRPVRQLERYLCDNVGREFIEVGDESWPIGGLRAERWQYWFPLPATRLPRFEKHLMRAQRLLGLKRRFPGGLTPRLGSQWWALTWETCNRILDFADANPAAMRFFRTVWIPDEMAIQTLVHHFVPSERIAGFTLTHYQFTRYGKPVVYYDDHADYVLGLRRFFVRKVSAEAIALRARCLAHAAEADDGEPLDRIGAPNDDYFVKTRAQTHYPPPGQAFYRSQFDDQDVRVLETLTTPYVVVIAPTAVADAVLEQLRGTSFTTVGRVFAAERVDLGSQRREWYGLRTDDAALRDLHPALYLARLRSRAEGVPVLACSPFDETAPLDAIIDDRAALKVACLPMPRRPEVFARELLGWDNDVAAAIEPPPFDHPLCFDATLATRLPHFSLARLQRLADLMRWTSPTTIRLPLPAAHAGGEPTMAGFIRQSVETCEFQSEPWFAEVVRAVERAASAFGTCAEGTTAERADAAE